MKRLLFVSLKGGCGSTTVAANLAQALVKINKQVHKYIETTENESYVQAKNKWLVFQANSARNALPQVRNKQKGLETEAI